MSMIKNMCEQVLVQIMDLVEILLFEVAHSILPIGTLDE